MNKDKDTPAQQDLKATSDSIRHDAERLAQLEERKSELDPGDPRVDQLSRDVETLIGDIADKGKAERELAERERPDTRRAN